MHGEEAHGVQRRCAGDNTRRVPLDGGLTLTSGGHGRMAMTGGSVPPPEARSHTTGTAHACSASFPVPEAYLGAGARQAMPPPPPSPVGIARRDPQRLASPAAHVRTACAPPSIGWRARDDDPLDVAFLLTVHGMATRA